MTTAFPFQARELAANWDRPAWGLNWDPGTGKSFAIIENAAMLSRAGKIRGMVVVAPNGVHRNWVTDELPRHAPPGWRTFAWFTSRAGTAKHEREYEAFERGEQFSVLAVSFDGLMTEACALAVKAFMKRRPCLLAIDESHMVKAPDAKRTKRVLAMSAYAPYRRIATGTIVADRPFDVYSQVKFLEPDVWKQVGCGSFQAFKAQFAEWEQRWGAAAGRFYPELKGYRNLDQMQAIVASLCSRVRKEEVLADLPPKSYSRRYFELSPEQRRVYRELKREAMAELATGELVTAPLVVTRMLRMQQVSSGYLPSDLPDEDGDRPLIRIGDSNPRLACLLETLEGLPHQAIVWAQRRDDVDRILAAMAAEGLTAARYDGRCSDDEAADSIARFRRGDAQFFVSNPAKGGTGLTLNEAKTMVFYNTGWKLGERLQAEDRAHRIGQDCRLHVVDIVGMLSPDEPTLDLGILRALAAKKELAAQVQGDAISEWLSPSIAATVG